MRPIDAPEVDWIPDALNLNDQTCAGMRHKTEPIFSVQYHPEAAPGPLDSGHLFARFREMVLGQGATA